MMLVKSVKSTEFFAAMNHLNKDLMDSGALIAAEGLHPSSMGARVTIANGRRVVYYGPFDDPGTLIAGFWIIQANSKVEALQWAMRCPLDAGQTKGIGTVGRLEIRPVIDFADLDVEAESQSHTSKSTDDDANLKRFVVMMKSDATLDSGKVPPADIFQEMDRVLAEMSTQGRFLMGEGLRPSSKGLRVAFDGGRRVITDGPFKETKELIAGFGMIRSASLDDAVEWAACGLEIDVKWRGGEGECEVREEFDT